MLKEQWKEVEIVKIEVKPSDTVIVGEIVTLQLELRSPFPDNWLEITLVLENSENNKCNNNIKDINLTCIENDPIQKYFVYAIELETANPEIRTYTVRVCPNPNLFPEHLDLDLVAR
jgi:starch phosphorylase